MTLPYKAAHPRIRELSYQKKLKADKPGFDYKLE